MRKRKALLLNGICLGLAALLAGVASAQEIWSGNGASFIKADGADWTDAANQDRITSQTWITRKDNEGLFNIQQEAGYSNNISPVNTEWAYDLPGNGNSGLSMTAENFAALTFDQWKGAVNGSPPSAVGLPAVLHLIAEDIYTDITVTSWTSESGGGFAYDRGTHPGAFEVIVLPDTQRYSLDPGRSLLFIAQTQWIVDHKVANKIAFTTLVGDIVERGGAGDTQNQAEWDRATAAMDLLDGDLNLEPEGVLPYVAVPGNHDYDIVDDKTSAAQYVAHFGPARYSRRSWFVENSADGTNQAQVFLGDGKPFLNLGLEWRPSDDALEWAQRVLNAYPDIPAIISTHEYLHEGNPALRRNGGEVSDGSGNNGGDSVYQKLVVPYPQVFLVLSGHHTAIGQLSSTTILGRAVHQILTNYQSDPNGGNGWMERILFDPLAGELTFSTFSPTYIPGTTLGLDRSTLAESNYTTNTDFEGLRDYLDMHTVLHFRQEQNGGYGSYAGAVDTHVGNGLQGTTLPNNSYGSSVNVRINGTLDFEQGLLRFEDIIGNGAGQIPPGATIVKAILTLTTEGSYSDGSGARLHRMLTSWDGNSTWNSLGAGVQLGVEAETIFDADSSGSVSAFGTDSFDVTASVQAWSDGTANYGWVMLSTGNNRWEFRSSEWEAITERPMLTVVTSSACLSDTDGDGICDPNDNCLLVANAGASNCDTDLDGYGNMCDADFDNGGSVNTFDFTMVFLPDFVETALDSGSGTDMDCDGTVNPVDFTMFFIPQFLGTGVPGPSGLACAGTTPCP